MRILLQPIFETLACRLAIHLKIDVVPALPVLELLSQVDPTLPVCVVLGGLRRNESFAGGGFLEELDQLLRVTH